MKNKVGRAALEARGICRRKGLSSEASAELVPVKSLIILNIDSIPIRVGFLLKLEEEGKKEKPS